MVQHIPTVNSSDTSGNSGTFVAPGGILLDYTTYAAVYKRDILAKGSTSDPYLPNNHVWLSTQMMRTHLPVSVKRSKHQSCVFKTSMIGVYLLLP